MAPSSGGSARPPPQPRTRRPRAPKPGQCNSSTFKTLLLANTTTWSGAQALIERLGQPGQPSKPDLLVLLEHRKATSEACKEAEDWAKGRGFHLAAALARPTGPGHLQSSGGVAVGTLHHIGLTESEGFAAAFADFPGRVHAMVINCIFPKGLLLIGAYWRDGLDLSMLERLGAYVLGCNRPWVIAGDWNAPPATLRRTGWLGIVNGHLRAPSSNSCEMGKGSIIDYLVISEDMAALYASDSLWISAPITPHHAFIVTFRTDHREALYLRRIAPKVFQIHPPPSGANENLAPTAGHGHLAPCRLT